MRKGRFIKVLTGNGRHICSQQKGHRASKVVLVVKNPSANEGNTRDISLIPGLGRSPGGGNGNPLQYSCLIINTEEPGRLSLLGCKEFGDDLVTEHILILYSLNSLAFLKNSSVLTLSVCQKRTIFSKRAQLCFIKLTLATESVVYLLSILIRILDKKTFPAPFQILEWI